MRKILNKLLENGGLWFTTLMIHLTTAFITVSIYVILGVIIKWIELKT